MAQVLLMAVYNYGQAHLFQAHMLLHYREGMSAIWQETSTLWIQIGQAVHWLYCQIQIKH